MTIWIIMPCHKSKQSNKAPKYAIYIYTLFNKSYYSYKEKKRKKIYIWKCIEVEKILILKNNIEINNKACCMNFLMMQFCWNNVCFVVNWGLNSFYHFWGLEVKFFRFVTFSCMCTCSKLQNTFFFI